MLQPPDRRGFPFSPLPLPALPRQFHTDTMCKFAKKTHSPRNVFPRDTKPFRIRKERRTKYTLYNRIPVQKEKNRRNICFPDSLYGKGRRNSGPFYAGARNRFPAVFWRRAQVWAARAQNALLRRETKNFPIKFPRRGLHPADPPLPRRIKPPALLPNSRGGSPLYPRREFRKEAADTSLRERPPLPIGGRLLPRRPAFPQAVFRLNLFPNA